MRLNSKFFSFLKSFGLLIVGLITAGSLLAYGTIATPQLKSVPQVKGATTPDSPSEESHPKPTQLTRNLFLGETGPEVELLQEKLDLRPTGLFERTTRAKVLQEQLRKGIINSSLDYGAGYVGPRTRLWLNKGIVIRAPKPSQTVPQPQPSSVIQPEPVPAPAPSPEPAPSAPPEATKPSPLPPSPEPAPEPAPAPTPPPEEIEVATASVNIEDLGDFKIELQKDDTALSILLRAGQENNFEVKTKSFAGLGEYVESIGEKAADSNHYWAFYYNGSYSMVGAGSQPVQKEDITSWKYESF